MLWITLTAVRLVMPAKVFLGVGDTVELPAFVVEKGKRKRVKPQCALVKGESVKVLGNRLIGVKEGRSLVGCRYRDGKRVTVAVVSERLRQGFRPPKRVLILRVGESVPLPRMDVPEGHEVKWFVKPRWLARIVGDSIEGLSEGRGIVQVHIVKGNVVVREFPVRLVVIEEDTSVEVSPRFARLKVGEAVKFKLLGDYEGEVEWYVLNPRIGRVSEDGLFVALRPGRTVIVARVKGKDGEVLSAKALVVVRPRKGHKPKRR